MAAGAEEVGFEPEKAPDTRDVVYAFLKKGKPGKDEPGKDKPVKLKQGYGFYKTSDPKKPGCWRKLPIEATPVDAASLPPTILNEIAGRHFDNPERWVPCILESEEPLKVKSFLKIYIGVPGNTSIFSFPQTGDISSTCKYDQDHMYIEGKYHSVSNLNGVVFVPINKEEED